MRDTRGKHICNLTLLLILLAFGQPAFAKVAQWSVTVPKVPPTQLPKLAQPLVLDGDLREWASAVCMPVRCRSYITMIRKNHEWRGPDDAGMCAYCAWNGDGLCLAAEVTDDEVLNDRADDKLFEQDCVQMWIDGRSGKEFGSLEYTPGAYQLLVRPPTGDRAAGIAAAQPKTGVAGLRVGGKRTANGYIIETLIPWSAFPKLSPKPGASVAFQFQLDDYDSRMAGGTKAVSMSYMGKVDVVKRLQRLTKWVLVEKLKTGPKADLGPLVAIDYSLPVTEPKTPISVEVCRPLCARAGSMHISVKNAAGKLTLERSIEIPSRDKSSCTLTGALEVAPASLSEGYNTISVVVNDTNGKPLGVSRRYVPFLRELPQKMRSRIAEVDLAKLSQTDPFKAAAYLGAAVRYLDDIKPGLEHQGMEKALAAADGLRARLDILEGADPGRELPGLLDLLRLAGNPEAQVVVEYPYEGYAAVSFCWGAIPIAMASVSEYRDEAEAAKALEPWGGGSFLVSPSEKTFAAGLPARIRSWSYEYNSFDLDDFAPDKQVLLFSGKVRNGLIIDMQQLPDARMDAVAVLPDCGEAVRESVEALARKAKVPVMDVQKALAEKDKVLIAGDVRKVDAVKALRGAIAIAQPIERSKQFKELSALSGRRVINVYYTSKGVAEQVVKLIAAGKPVTPAQVDEIRAELVRSLAPANASSKMPEGTRLYCGDLHMHTLASDGSGSPVGLLLQAMHCYLDFAAMTDHNTLKGALLGERLLKQYGFAYPLTIGEEITTDTAHFNAYPLKELVSWQQPFDQIIEAAHKQGAVIHWNHPPWPGGDTEWGKEHAKNGIAGTGLDAWEHYPAKYEEWKRAGKLPVLVGTTDTHSGTFEGQRTIIFAPAPTGDDVAEAIRHGRAVAVFPFCPQLFYGPDDNLISVVWSALAEGKALKAAKAEQLRSTLKNADLAGILQADQPEIGR